MTDQELRIKANEVRKGIIEGVYNAKSGHPGGSLSAAEVLTYLYFEEMNIDPKDPRRRTGTDSSCQRAMQHRRITQHWHAGVISLWRI